MENTNQFSLMNFSERVQDEDLLIKFYLITNDDGELSNEMKKAHEALLEKVPDKSSILLLSEKECLELSKDELTAETIFIMEKFEGDAFHYIEELKTIFILGVKAICTVLYEQINIPTQHHIHNLSMKNLYICFSSIEDKKKKARMIKLVHYMGGIYSNSLKEITTHLITRDVHSQKYYYANEHKMKIMKPEWIEDYWQMHQDINFTRSPDDEMFDSYKLPIFNGVVACSTGIDITTKKQLMQLIESNGGEFSQTFKTSTVTILFMTQKDIDSPKGKAAMKFKIKCANPSWVQDSVAAGYALPLKEKYLIEPTVKSSTPTKNSSGLGKFFDNTMLSDITAVNATQKNLTFDETHSSTRASVARVSTAISSEYNPQAHLQRQVTEKSVMRDENKSNRVTRVSSITKNDTFKKPQLLRATKSSTTTIRDTIHEKENIQDEQPEKEAEKTMNTEDESYIQFLGGMNIMIYGYNMTEEVVQIMEELEKLGANVVDPSFNKTLDYIVTPPLFLDYAEPKNKHKFMVNDTWIEESIAEGKAVDIKFYHNPLFRAYRSNVLKDELFVTSTYETERERPFIKEMIAAMGGRCKEALNKNEDAILLCPTPAGKKYEGAIKWNFTVLRAEWLLECCKNNMRYDETPFLVGDSRPSKKNKKNQRESIIPFSQGTPESEGMEIDNIESVLPKRIAELRPRTNSPQTPTTPDRSLQDGILSVSDIVADMPTPQRVITKAAILEQQGSNKMSPRAARQRELLKTPGANQNIVYDESSPMPELPEIMRPPPGEDFSLRPDSSPTSQWFWKMKMDILDDQYVPRSDSLKKALREEMQVTPMAIKRYNFFKRTIPNYNSPDPSNKDNGQVQLDNDVNMEDEAANSKVQEELLNILKSGERDNSAIPRTSRSSGGAKKQLDLNDEALETFDPTSKPMVWATSTQKFQVAMQHVVVQSEKLTEVTESEEMSVDENNYVPDESSPIHILEDQESSASPSALDSDGNEIDFMGQTEKSEYHTSENYVFAVSSCHNNEEKAQIISNITDLGGKIDENDFTYLIMPKLTKSSKYFCALARGNFILHPDFIRDSKDAKKFLDPEDYEYGNPKLKINTSALKALNEILRGPYVCRQAIKMNPEKYRNGLFSGMKFLIVAAKEKREIFSFIISSGGGIVIDEAPEFKAAVLKRENIDYCLVDNPHAISDKDKKTLGTCSITIKNVRFIYEYLLSENLLT